MRRCGAGVNSDYLLEARVSRDVPVGYGVLVKDEAFCALAVFVLALGICVVTTMFAVVEGVLLRRFSFPNARRLVDREDR